MKRPEKCFQCLQVWQRHENALQFRIGACVKNIDQVVGHRDCILSKNVIIKLACNFPPDLPMETLLRLRDSVDVPCPFSGSYNFTYR